MKPTFNLGPAAHLAGRARPVALVLLILLLAFGVAASPMVSAPVAAQQSESPTANPSWIVNTVDGPSMFYNMSTRSLRYTSTGVPCVAYGADHLYFSCYDGNQKKWIREVVDATNQVGQWASLAFSTSDSPRISYYDAANNSLNFAYKVGVTWYITVVDTPNDGNAPLAEDMQSSPAVQELQRQSQPRRQLDSLLPPSYLDSLTPDDPNAGLVGVYSTIAVGTDNKVHIAYYDGITGDLKHAGFDGITWTVTVVDGQNIKVGTWPAIALDSHNNPGISYMDEKYDDLKYAWYDGSWHNVTVDSEDPYDVDSVGPFTSLAYDSNNKPHISYLFNGSPPGFTPKFLRYASPSGSSWVTLDLDTNSGDVGWDTSIAIDGNNGIWISYYDYSHGDLKLAKKTGSSFNISTLQSSGNVGRYTSIARYGSTMGITYMSISTGEYYYIADSGSGWSSPSLIDVSGELGFNTSLATNKFNSGMITYFDEVKDDVKIAFGWGASWNKGVLDGPNNMGPYSSAKFNSKSEPMVAYYDLGNGNLQFAYWYANAWRFQTVDSNNDVGKFVSLAVDSLDRPHVAYYDATNLDLKYAFANWDTTNKVWAWTIQPAVDTGGDVGQFASLGLDSNNSPYITYYDVTNTALKHAFKSPIDAWVSEFVDNSAAVGQFSSLAVYNPTTLYVTYYDQTNGNLLFAQKNGSIWTAGQIVDGGMPNVDVGQYTSLAFDASGDGRLSYYDVTNGDLKYAFYDLPAGTWTVDPTPIDSSGNVGLFTSLAINSNGQVGISYYDYTNSDLKFAMLAGSYPWAYLPIVVVP
jgi:hypothetical protein